jgi:hypothetical protein
LARVIRLTRSLPFAPEPARFAWVPSARTDFREPIRLVCPLALAIAVGDVNGDSFPDLALACREKVGVAAERSWFIGSDAGFSEANCTGSQPPRDGINGPGPRRLRWPCSPVFHRRFFLDLSGYRGSRQRQLRSPVELATADARRPLLLAG